VDRPAILVAFRRFRGLGEADSRSLRFDSYARMQHVDRQYIFIPFQRFWGMYVWREFMQRLYMLLFMVL
jgi:hypothetical protein